MRREASVFSEEFLSRFTPDSNIETMWTAIKEKLLSLRESFVPSKMTSSRFHQPWVNTEVKRLSRQKNRAFKKLKTTRKSKDKDRYQSLKKKCNQACKDAYNSYLCNMFDPAQDSNNKRFWSYIKSKKADNIGIAPLQSQSGAIRSDSKSKAEILNSQFCSVFSKDKNIPFPAFKWKYPSMRQIIISSDGIQKLLDQLKENKAPGPDNLPPILLKSLSTELAPCLQVLFQSTLQQKSIPVDWKHACVTPLFKKGSVSKPENYRPVSLTSIICKAMEHIIYSQVMRHLSDFSILADAQHGFRARRSCETQLILTTDDLLKSIDTKSQVDMILLDFAKAFDRVPHHLLIYKLGYYGIDADVLGWITSFLGNRTQEVVVDGEASQKSSVDSGVPQGSVLGPLLFLLYINDLPAYPKNNSTTRLFADDSVIYRQIDSEADAALLQEDLNRLLDWEKDWGMSFHPNKCQVISVAKKRNIVDFSYTMKGHILDKVDSVKYLGVTINNGGSWNNHINNITASSHKTLSFLQRNLSHCPMSVKELSYKSLVRSKVEYATTIWDPHTKSNIDKLEMIQRKGARFVCGDFRRYSSVTEMLQRLQWESLQARRKAYKLVMMYKTANNLVDLSVANFNLQQSPIHPHKYIQPFTRTDCYKFSYIPSVVRLWNGLPASVAQAPTIGIFRPAMQAVIYQTY